MTNLAWVVGASGLLGKSMVRTINKNADWTLFTAASLPWGSSAEFANTVRANVQGLFEQARHDGADWSIIWAAGSAFTSSTQAQLDAEMAEFTTFLEILAAEVSSSDSTGTMFLASSGGGIYGGATSPPFNEDTAPSPLGAYGQFKLAMETELARFSDTSKTSVLIGRISNLYGPGQRIDKMQGLITHLALARYGTKPAFIFVPLGTVRDYIFVDDCAKLILASIQRLSAEASSQGGPIRVTKILGSGQAISISTLLGYYRGITKAAPRVVHGTAPATKFQSLDLSMKSVVWPDLDLFEKTPVAAGFSATMQDVLRLIQR